MVRYYSEVNTRGRLMNYAEFNGIIFSEHGNTSRFRNVKHGGLHQYVYCYYHKLQKVPKGYDIHHIDGNPLNNDISNLQLLTRSEHMKIHQPGKTMSQDAINKCLETKKLNNSTKRGKDHYKWIEITPEMKEDLFKLTFRQFHQKYGRSQNFWMRARKETGGINT